MGEGAHITIANSGLRVLMIAGAIAGVTQNIRRGATHIPSLRVNIFELAKI